MTGQIQAPRRPARPTAASTSHRGRIMNAALALVGLGMGACVGLAIDTETAGALRAPGGVATFAGQLAGLTGAYLMLVMLLLVARIPVIERAAGQDRMVKWHRNLGQWPVYLICLHVVLITVGYAQSDHIGVINQFDQFIESYPDVLGATVSLGLILTASVLSIRSARRRMRYETWWTVHLYLYLALALAFSHQLANGVSFVGHPLTRAVWATAWAATAGTVLVFRFLLPLTRTVYHGLRVVGIQREAEGVTSIVCSGRHLDRLGVEGGQFFHWRLLTRGMWWQAHPYSLSALPRSGLVRFTVKELGDHSSRLAGIPLGTKVAIEGPYGAFTRHALRRRRVLLIGAGVGVTPIRALLEHLEPHVDVTVILRSSTDSDQLFRDEFRSLVRRRRGRLIELVGSRRDHPLDARQLVDLVPDIAACDLYVCGPDPLSRRVVAATRQLGLSEDQVHCEQFAF